MARARNIKPGFFKNELLVEQPLFVRMLFVGLWTLADREGRVEDRPKRIKLELFPYDTEDVDSALDALQENGFIERYQVGGAKVIQITNFLKHQTPHGTEKDSTLPAKDGSLTVHERDAKGYVTGTKRTNNVNSRPNNVNPPLPNDAVTVRHPANNTLNPDSPNPESIPPIPPKGGKVTKDSPISFDVWLKTVKDNGEKPIPEDDPVHAYAAEVGIPYDFLALCWNEFKDRYRQPGAKRYKDWRAVFRKAVRGNWFKLWWIEGDGSYTLTTVGKQAERKAA